MIIDFDPGGGWADFNLFIVDYSAVGESTMWGSDNFIGSVARLTRPIVTLNFDIEINPENQGDGSSPEKAWQLK